ncbi:uncharacterized protein BO97DRAFT_279243 [Aspergillus homomorphus CBS 101889]|uniref:Uncharacterized protein n=1 Tax=Aspergillus homomorphus (strain CBS 101889) TaxID=1450537 RepID=A0A395HGK5_ASPHC|nr:hypothetical protein BO97DRAFT_279243 [Aspergillus homomorphus CBS 101889]RAL06776.1 hypothetical protein BO97DRAFT_279243 [Aspergillus homomorphus CBS 101889]
MSRRSLPTTATSHHSLLYFSLAMEYPVDPQGQQENRFSDIANLWDRAVGDVLVCFAGLSFAKQPPVASYHDLEHGSPFADQEYAGGLQACVIVRYHKSPIGRSSSPEDYADC